MGIISQKTDHLIATPATRVASHLGKSILKVIDGTGSPSCPLAGFDVSSTDPSVPATKELITYSYYN
jgi:hypothetical protein